jgi:hypothetical protein
LGKKKVKDLVGARGKILTMRGRRTKEKMKRGRKIETDTEDR